MDVMFSKFILPEANMAKLPLSAPDKLSLTGASIILNPASNTSFQVQT